MARSAPSNTSISAAQFSRAIQNRKASTASLIVDVEGSGDHSAEQVAALIAQGALLRHYNFKKYFTKKNNDDAADKDGLKKLIVHVAHPDKAKAAFHPLKAVANGVNFARDLVNEPANILGPVELADKTKALEKLGVYVDILDVKDMEKLGMGSLLCVGQGSTRPSRLAVMVGTAPRAPRSRSPLFRRQRRHFRHRRHLDQTGRQHGGHEGRHGRRRVPSSA